MTKKVDIGNITIGGGSPVAIQSMANARTTIDIIAQIKELEENGCEIARIAVKDAETAESVAEIKKSVNIPLVADIHFDYRLALQSVASGIDKLRINPGNIGSIENVQKVVSAAKERRVPIRIGVNGGSLEPELFKKHGGVTADALCESALGHVHILEDLDFSDIVISIKSSSVPLTYEAYTKLSKLTEYPLHIGITEAGTKQAGTIKSAACLGALLLAGIGDTLRVSLTANPLEEVIAARQLLQALEMRRFGVNIIACPTCGRTEVDLIKMAEIIEKNCQGVKKNINVAVMGCAVNGPGEAKDADIGIACGKGCGVLFKQGLIVKKLDEQELVPALLDEINRW
ncbi:4-hydroxy-3-methylbut-2-en-1-yl diphosphate synthase (flavodoxin) [Clostridia bacterium]|nr:4-hydroxy-3-methylbut-2-en-1-yl diphosphate synthase (flavodoxin) [Clostridia bacterium]